MRLTISADLAKGHAQLDRLQANIRKAQVRAANELRRQARTAGLRAVNTEYSIGPRTMEQYVSERDATEGEPEAAITVKGGRFSLAQFKPVRTARGVSVIIKGRRIVVPHSFMVARFGTHVFARGAYGGRGVKQTGETSGRFIYGRGRLPINELFTFGPADAFSNSRVVDAMNARVDEQLDPVMRRELAAVARGF